MVRLIQKKPSVIFAYGNAPFKASNEFAGMLLNSIY